MDSNMELCQNSNTENFSQISMSQFRQNRNRCSPTCNPTSDPLAPILPQTHNLPLNALPHEHHANTPASSVSGSNLYGFLDVISGPGGLLFPGSENIMTPKHTDNYNDDFKMLHEEFSARKYFHPLYAHGICRWPGCEQDLDDIALFVKHLNTEHGLDDRSTAQARVQMQVVSQLETHLQKERDRLQAMMHHLYLTKQLLAPTKSECKDFLDLQQDSGCGSAGGVHLGSIPVSMNSPILGSANISALKKRINEKSTLSIAGGLPYMLERAGLDVQQEIQRNREFYKNADVRPPFTYASLIRQSIIESPDKQLTLNEIYNWFQNTFCYFRRNAATWKNAIRTNLSLHKCFVRYEDDFGSFWMVDDSEFIKRRHLSRGRPRKYEPSSSPNSAPSGSASATNQKNQNRNPCDNCPQHCANGSGSGDTGTCGTSRKHKPNDAGDVDSFNICIGSQKNRSNKDSNKSGQQFAASELLSTSQKIAGDMHAIRSDADEYIDNNINKAAIVGINNGGYNPCNFDSQNMGPLTSMANPSSLSGQFSPGMQSIWGSGSMLFDETTSLALHSQFLHNQQRLMSQPMRKTISPQSYKQLNSYYHQNQRERNNRLLTDDIIPKKEILVKFKQSSSQNGSSDSEDMDVNSLVEADSEHKFNSYSNCEKSHLDYDNEHSHNRSRILDPNSVEYE